MKNRFTSLLLILAPLVIFFYALYVLFDLRFDTGEIYPPYSSFRADPLGAKMLYEGLHEMPGVDVSRNLRALAGYPVEEKAAIFYLGHQITTYGWQDQPTLGMPQEYKASLEEVKRNGGRLVIGLLPETKIYGPSSDPDIPGKVKKYMGQRSRVKQGEPKEPEADQAEEERAREEWSALTWGVALGFAPLEAAAGPGATHLTSPDWPPLAWHTTTFFKPLHPEWKVLYRQGDHPVIMERPWGRGSVVLASDAYFLSNEAMIKDRHIPLILYLIGDNTRVVFEENHFSIMHQPGVAGLARQYGLQATLWSFLVLAGLFVWKNAFSLVPPPAEDPSLAGTAVGGKQAAEGFINLLRRNIPAARLMQVCFDEWDATYARNRRDMQARRQRMAREVSAAHPKDPLSCYRKLNRLFKERE